MRLPAAIKVPSLTVLLLLVAAWQPNRAADTYPYLAIPNSQKVNAGLWRGAQPNAATLRMLRDDGCRTLVDLRLPGHGTRWEAAQARKLGLNYYNIPMSFDKPSQAKVDLFMSIARNPDLQPVFVHCRQGADRTGTLLALYRIVNEGWSYDEAYWEMRVHHFKPELILLKNTVRRCQSPAKRVARTLP